ncbi:MAG: CHAT domain-containing protein [Acidobacteriota bacterium]|nr:CHAT domain-containing protein [Acidobacteriota bacterium]
MSEHQILVHFGNLRDGSCDIYVKSPAGEENGVFSLPFDDEHIRRIDDFLEQESSHCPGDSRELHPKQIGRFLFQALFRDRVLVLYRKTLMLAEKRRPMVFLKMNPRGQGFDILGKLPWEFMYDVEEQSFVTTQNGGAIVRQLVVTRLTARREVFAGSWKMLAASANPRKKGVTEFPQEKHLVEVTANTGSAESPLTDITRAKLAQALSKGPAVLHLYAHGIVHEYKGGCLLLNHENEGQAYEMSADDLANLIEDKHPDPQNIRLIFICACSSGRQAGDAPEVLGTAYSGIASALVLKGFANVIGMSHPVEDSQATLFAREFYQSIYKDGDDFGYALSKARAKIYGEDHNSLEWGKPVLFSHAGMERIPIVNWPFFKKVWTVLAVAVFYMCLTFFSQAQGIDLGLPTIGKVRYAAGTYGMFLCTPVYIIFMLMTVYHVKQSKGRNWYSRLPEFWAVTWNYAHPVSRVFQGFSFFLFVIITTYGQGFFFNKYLGGTVYYYPKDCPVQKEFRIDEMRHIREQIAELRSLIEGKPVAPAPEPCFRRLTFKRLDHFNPRKVLIPGHNIWNALSDSHDYVYDGDRIDYFPLWQTYLFTLEILIGLCLFIYLITILFFDTKRKETRK